mgnify:CR=1 FL=1
MKFKNFTHFVVCVLAFFVPSTGSIYLVQLFDLNDGAKLAIVLSSMMLGALLMIVAFMYWVIKDQLESKGRKL